MELQFTLLFLKKRKRDSDPSSSRQNKMKATGEKKKEKRKRKKKRRLKGAKSSLVSKVHVFTVAQVNIYLCAVLSMMSFNS